MLRTVKYLSLLVVQFIGALLGWLDWLMCRRIPVKG